MPDDDIKPEDKDKNKPAGGADDDLDLKGGKKLDDDILNKDVSKFSQEQKDDYIEKLKDENARRRIAAKKLKDKTEKTETELADTKQKLTDLSKKVEDFTKKEKELTDKEKSDIERLTTKVKELETSLSTQNEELNKSKRMLREKDLRITQQKRENMVDRLVKRLDFQFASEFERTGFLAEVLKADDKGEFLKNEDELVLSVQDFIKERKAAPKTPGAGPGNRQAEAPVGKEIQALLAKEDLSAEENKRLDELLKLVGEEQA